MANPIRHALYRALVLLLSLLIPATGRRRRLHGPRQLAPMAPRTLSGLRLLIRRTVPPGLFSPDRMKAPALLDDPSPLVRPYLLAHERRQQQQERRAALVLAMDGIDVGPWVIHGHRIGTPAGVAA
ncbi:hypothetical protein [Streptomyces poonensis]|uniref:Uncharacterized protein n=1 Tax=Streptomyces poonensis TaxID=68255 RepID=A0A918PJV1_9ACTN|nr:hypothetical protein [Streptomyces poonensis]GGZ13382.1 hypothetical protein GCM10010365_36530 [Streptomyces poonensis]GLJ91201.1 hypothetical protein GCM10017589_38070 [Streptomyces poonensis]